MSLMPESEEDKVCIFSLPWLAIVVPRSLLTAARPAVRKASQECYRATASRQRIGAAENGAFAPAASSDPVFRARRGSGQLAAKDLLHSG